MNVWDNYVKKLLFTAWKVLDALPATQHCVKAFIHDNYTQCMVNAAAPFLVHACQLIC